MNAIKEFLKPNRWKVGLFFLIIIASVPAFVIAPGPLLSVIMFLLFNPAPFFLFDILFDGGGLLPSTLEMLIALLYWYLLACLIYFIFSKIRNLKK